MARSQAEEPDPEQAFAEILEQFASGEDTQGAPTAEPDIDIPDGAGDAKWVAMVDRRVVAFGNDLKDILRQCQRETDKTPTIIPGWACKRPIPSTV